MNSDPLSSILFLLSAVPTSPPHEQLNVTIYENGLATSSLNAPVLSESDLSQARFCPTLLVAIRSVHVHAAIRWPRMIPAYQITDSLSDALYMIGRFQVVFCRSELAFLISGNSAQEIVSRCHYHNEKIPWETLMLLDAQTRQMAQFENVPVDPIEQFLSLEEFQMRETAVYEPVVQPNELVNDYDGPLFDDWNLLAHPTSYECGSHPSELYHYPSMSMYPLPSGVYPVEYSAPHTLPCDISVTFGEPAFQPSPEYQTTLAVDSYEEVSNSPSPSSTCSSPFPETPANFRSELPHVVSPMSTLVHDVTAHEEQQTSKVTQIIHPAYAASPASALAPSPLSECKSLPSSRCSSASPSSSQSSERDSTSPILNDQNFQVPIRMIGKKIRRNKTGAIRKKKTKSKEKHFCQYCNESFTRDHDAERHQRTCKSNPDCSQKEQCKVCAKPLPVRLDARRRHWGTLECSDAARKLGYTRMDEETYEFL